MHNPNDDIIGHIVDGEFTLVAFKYLKSQSLNPKDYLSKDQMYRIRRKLQQIND